MAQYPTCSLSGGNLYSIVWDVIEILELNDFDVTKQNAHIIVVFIVGFLQRLLAYLVMDCLQIEFFFGLEEIPHYQPVYHTKQPILIKPQGMFTTFVILPTSSRQPEIALVIRLLIPIAEN